MNNTLSQADNSFKSRIQENEYPGRGIAIGLDESQQFFIQACWIMGRSPNSRNRIYQADDYGNLNTKPIDKDNVENAKLIMYRGMTEDSGIYIVSNGNQTDTILEHYRINYTCSQINLQEALMTRSYEPDAPHFTPRISGLISLKIENPFAELSILKKSKFGNGCDSHLYHYDQFYPGIGYCITTYLRDGDPLPSFEGDPFLIPLKRDIDSLTEKLWSGLDQENKISLAVKFINIKNGRSTIKIVNKY